MRAIPIPRSLVARHGHLLVPVALFLILLLLMAFRSPGLFTVSGLAGAILVATPLILATLAVTPIVMVGRGSVDLSVGPLLGFLNVTLITWLVANGVTNPVAFFLWAIGAGAAYQFLQALVIVYVRVAPIIVTLSSFLFLSGVNLTIMRRPGGIGADWMATWGAGTEVFSPVFFILLAGFAIWFLFSRTTFYTHLKMTGADERTAYTGGVRINLVRIGAHVLGGVYVGLAAICYTALISSGDPTQGSTYTLQAVTALVLGGTSLVGGRGGAIGSILGAIDMYLIVRLLATFNFGLVSGFATQLSFGLILIASLLINVFLTGSKGAGAGGKT